MNGRSPVHSTPIRSLTVRIGVLLSGILAVFIYHSRPVALAQSDVRLELEKKAEFWSQNGREDLAAQTYRQILFLDPSNRKALIGLAEASILTGHKADAETYIRKIRTQNPQDPSLLFFSRETALGPQWTSAIKRARFENSRRHYQKAIDAFRTAFGPLPPPPNFAVEYYHALLHLDGGKAKALSELEDLVRRYPKSQHYRLAYGEILSYHPDMRHKAIRILKPMALEHSSVSQRSQEDWRRVLVWSGDDPAFLPELSDYLKTHPDPELAKLRVRALRRRIQEGSRPKEAYKALHEGRFRDARNDFRRLLDQDPGNGSYRIGLASTYFGEHRFDRTRQVLAEARHSRLDPKDRKNLKSLARRIRFWTLMDEGKNFELKGDDARALDRYRSADAIEPDNPAVLDGLSGLALKNGHPEEALSLSRRALHLRHSDSLAWAGVLNALTAEKHYAEAREFLDGTTRPRLKGIEREHPSVLITEAILFAETGDRKTADRKLEDARIRLPNPTPVQEISLSWGYYALNQDLRLSQTLKHLRQEKGLTPVESRQLRELEHLLLLSNVNRYLSRKAYPAALSRVNAAIQAHPGDSFYVRELATVTLASGQSENAFRIIQNLGPGPSLDTYEPSVQIALQAGHFRQAQTWSDEAQKRWPGQDKTILIQAQVLAALGQRAKARELIRSALARDPGNPRLLLGLAQIDVKDNRLPEAQKSALLALGNSRNLPNPADQKNAALDAQNTLDTISRQERELGSDHFEFLLGETVFSQYTQYFYTQIGGFFPVGMTQGPGGISTPIYLHAFVFGSAFNFKYLPSQSSASYLSQAYFGGTPAIGVKLPTPFGSWEGDAGWGIAQHDQTLTAPGTVTGLFLQTDLQWNLMGGVLDLFANYTGYINYVYFQSRYLRPAWSSTRKDLTFGLGPEFIVQGNQNYSAYMGGAAFQFFVRPLRSTLLLDTGLLGSSAFPGIGGYEGFSWYFYY